MKTNNSQHDTICRVDFDRKAIEHDTIKLASSHNSVHTRTIEWQNRIYLFFVFFLFSTCLIFVFDSWTLEKLMCFNEDDQQLNETKNGNEKFI